MVDKSANWRDPAAKAHKAMEAQTYGRAVAEARTLQRSVWTTYHVCATDQRPEEKRADLRKEVELLHMCVGIAGWQHIELIGSEWGELVRSGMAANAVVVQALYSIKFCQDQGLGKAIVAKYLKIYARIKTCLVNLRAALCRQRVS